MKKFFLNFIGLLVLLFSSEAKAQYTNNIWCFGDSAGIDFNTCPPTPITSGMLGRAGSATICDSSGKLLFYCNGGENYLLSSGIINCAVVRTKNHQIMHGGDTLIGHWYHDMIILPKQISDSTFYIFNVGCTNDFGLYYNVVDLKLQQGLGEVVQKNVQLLNVPGFDDLSSVKHCNGTDWWLVFQDYKISFADSSNSFYIYHVDSLGIHALQIQNIGSYHKSNGGDISFNSDGSQMVFADYSGFIELYDFDRCNGIISNARTIKRGSLSPGNDSYYSAVFSSNDQILYLQASGSSQVPRSIYQLDLTAPNILATKTIIYRDSTPDGISHMEMGPDKKIYVTSMYECPWGACFPYPDTVHNYITDYLSVINYPDSLGAACDFQPFSFYLGGRRTYYGLPNNPDYTMDQSVHNPCDTLTAVHSNYKDEIKALKIYYQSQWDIAFINADKLTGRKYTLSLFDITGKLIFKEEGNLTSQYFTNDLSMQGFAKGVYLVTLESEKEKLCSRFVK